ncbi:MAG: MgtC/SapB family protein [Opitutaceae bacterium]
MPDLLVFIVVSACLGALIGLIRHWDEQAGKQPGDFAGVRTHTFWAVLGCLGAFASEAHVPYAFAIVLVLVSAHLIAQAAADHDHPNPGSTSFAGAMLTMFCGALVFWDELKSAVVVAATTMVLLGLKRPIHDWTRTITPQDIRATLQFVAITGVILPLVPNRDMGPFGGFNPFSTWLMVVLISGLGFAGYVAIRMVGSRAGILLTGILGGIASSTASALAFSRRSKEEPHASDHYALAVVAACTVMLPRVLIATSLINREFSATLLVPFALMAVPGVCYALWISLRRRPPHTDGEAPRLGNPLSLATAIKFAALYAVIAFLVKMVREQGWTEGMLPLSFVSGLTDMDAISLSIAREQGGEGATPGLATRAVVLAAVSNTLLKAGMATGLGSRGLKVRIGIVLGATAAVGVAWMLFGAGVRDGAS